MLKKSALRRIIVSSIALLLFFIICLIPSSNEKNNNISVIYEQSKEMPVYLEDPNGYIARINVSLIENEIEDIIDILTINGNHKNIMPSDFKPLIPENTKLIDYNIDNKIINLNFSHQLLNVSKENEEKMIESLIFTLCESEQIDGLILYVNGIQLKELPKSQKSLPNILDYSFGINKTYFLTNIKNINQVTVYYMSKYQNNPYYIPITKITNDQLSKIEIIINELKSTPFINGNISSYLKASYELEQFEVLENSIKLSFNNMMIAGISDEDIKEELKYILTLSIRDSYNIEDISININ